MGQIAEDPFGECRVKMINPANNKKYAVLFTVVDEDLMPVLGASASQQMGLITVNRANIRQVTATNREADILEKYKDVFNDDVGHFPGKAHLEVDATVKPVITPARTQYLGVDRLPKSCCSSRR